MVQTKVNKSATLKRVRGALLKAREYKLFGSVRREIRLTTSYEPRYHGETNNIRRPVEDLATDNLEDELTKGLYDSAMIALAHLPERERKLLEVMYFEHDRPPYWKMAESLHIGESTLRRLQTAAELKVAKMLGLEVSELQEGERSEPCNGGR
ncbi:ArpU family transcriptional regulator [Paenibacillus sp. y28]|uniref:ArpU family transcriptional regulator n=1 Tax=Paenibacillus sp. y28 TaxID=3129110 RepID=UPI0030174109